MVHKYTVFGHISWYACVIDYTCILRACRVYCVAITSVEITLSFFFYLTCCCYCCDVIHTQSLSFLGDWEEHAVLLHNYIALILLHETPDVGGRKNRVVSEVFIVLGRSIPEGDVVYVILQVCGMLWCDNKYHFNSPTHDTVCTLGWMYFCRNTAASPVT